MGGRERGRLKSGGVAAVGWDVRQLHYLGSNRLYKLPCAMLAHRCDEACLNAECGYDGNDCSMPVGCYQQRCSHNLDGTHGLEIMDPSGAWHACEPGLAITVAGYQGSILCPDEWQSLCRSPSVSAFDQGDCACGRLEGQVVRLQEQVANLTQLHDEMRCPCGCV